MFPYRRKELFEAGPPATQKRILGIPVISILGNRDFKEILADRFAAGSVPASARRCAAP